MERFLKSLPEDHLTLLGNISWFDKFLIGGYIKLEINLCKADRDDIFWPRNKCGNKNSQALFEFSMTKFFTDHN